MRRLVSELRAILAQGEVDKEAIEQIRGVVGNAVPRLRSSELCKLSLNPGRYLCYKDPDYGFVIMLMCWGPGDATPIHDHGCWGVETVLKNTLRVTEYTDCPNDPRPVTTIIAEPGQLLHQLPPERDVHKVEHHSGDYALSLHVYGREMNGNRQFVPGKGFVPCTLKTCEMKMDVLARGIERGQDGVA